MAIWDRARPKAVTSPPLAAASTAAKSKTRLKSMELPLSDYGKRVEYSYTPENSPNRMYDKDGVEMRACVVKVRKDGTASIEYEDGERGSIDIHWMPDA